MQRYPKFAASSVSTAYTANIHNPTFFRGWLQQPTFSKGKLNIFIQPTAFDNYYNQPMRSK